MAVAGSDPLTLAIVIDPDRRSTHLGRLLMAIYRLTPAEAIMQRLRGRGQGLQGNGALAGQAGVLEDRDSATS